MKILIADEIHESGKEILRKAGEVVDKPKIDEAGLLKDIVDADAVVVRSRTKITKAVIDAAKRLKVIGRAGVGVDTIDVDAATRRGIAVVNAPESTSITVAEHTMGLMLAMARKIPFAHASLKAGKWEKSKFMGSELRDKTLGIVGLGRIGSEVAKKARAFNMRIIGYDPYITEKLAKELGVELVDLDRLFASSDYITLHVPLTEQTKKLVGKKELSLMKKGAVLLNCARGGVVDEAALHEALAAGKLGGAALDVFEKEPATDSPLLKLENVIATPHLGASTEEAQRLAATIVCDEVIKILSNRPAKNVVNMPVLAPEVMEELRDYIRLAESLGSFAAQTAEGFVREVTITYCGRLSEVEDVGVLTNAVLMKLLAPALANEINILNASVMAKNRGIRVTEARREDAEKYGNLAIVDVKTDKDKAQAKGTLLGGEEPRIVGIAGYEIDLVPRGNLLMVVHEDRPGMIGKVATRLGERKINIAGMQVGRKDKGGTQLMLLTLDQEPSKEDIKAIASLEGIQDARAARL